MEQKNEITNLLASGNDEQKERVIFATLIWLLANGELSEVLKNAPVGDCEELGRIWDEQSHVPVGVLFQRPNFEEYEKQHTNQQ